MGLAMVFFFMFSPQSSKCCRIKSQASSVGESSNSLLMGTCVAYREFLLGTSTLPPMKGCVGPQLVFYFLLVLLRSLYFHFYICARTQKYTIYTLVGRAAFYNVSDSSMQEFFWGGPSVWRPRATFEVKCNAVAKEAWRCWTDTVLVFTVHSLNCPSISITIYYRSAIILSPCLSPKGYSS